jgi:hypothetical protein
VTLRQPPIANRQQIVDSKAVRGKETVETEDSLSQQTEDSNSGNQKVEQRAKTNEILTAGKGKKGRQEIFFQRKIPTLVEHRWNTYSTPSNTQKILTCLF